MENYKQPKAQWEICVAAPTQQDAVQIRELSLSGAQQQPANYLAFDPETDQWMIQNQRLAEQPVRFLKTDAGNKEHFLNGVSFKLYSCPNTETGHQHELLASQESQRNGCWEPVQEYGRDKLFTSTRLGDFDGMVDLGTLAEGEYMLVEVETLPGYVLPKGQWMLTVGDGLGDYEFTVKGDSNTPEFWRHSSGSAQDVIWAVSNEKEIIPITGAYVNGPKKLILILPGGILAVGMAWRLTYKRRKRSREKRG